MTRNPTKTRRQTVGALYSKSQRNPDQNDAGLGSLMARVPDMEFPEAKRGPGAIITIEDLILFRGDEIVGFDDCEDPGYMETGDEPRGNLAAAPIEFKATAYFTRLQWNKFKGFANKENEGRARKSNPDANGSIKIRGFLRAWLYLVPACPDGLLIESRCFYRYRVRSMAPGSQARSVMSFQRFRLLDFMTQCRKDAELEAETLTNARPADTQKTIAWLIKQFKAPRRAVFLDDELTKQNIEKQLRMHASWIASYLRPIKKNIFQQHFNIPIRQFEELAKRVSSEITTTSATYVQTEDDDSDDESIGWAPKPSASRKRVTAIESDDYDRRCVAKPSAIGKRAPAIESNDVDRKCVAKPSATGKRATVIASYEDDGRSWVELPYTSTKRVYVLDSDSDDEDHPAVVRMRPDTKRIAASSGYKEAVVNRKRKRSVSEADSDYEPEPAVRRKPARQRSRHEPRRRCLDDDSDEAETSDIQEISPDEYRRVQTRPSAETYVWDLLEENPRKKAAVPPEFRLAPDFSKRHYWRCPSHACPFEVVPAECTQPKHPRKEAFTPDQILRRLVQEHYLKHLPGLRHFISS